MDNNYVKKRLKEIVSVSVKHGFKNGIGNPEELRLVLEELGPTFVKIGQILSTRPDIIPKAYIEELQKLQDNVRPEKFSIMKELLEAELKGDINSIFMEFNTTPIASASLSEVYLAKLKTGEQVVIKVQRPNVKEKMLSDIKILRKLAPFINFTATGDVVDMKEVVDELKPNEGDLIVNKRRYSSFYQTDLELILRERGIDTVIITGVMTNICVRSTAHDAFFKGFNVIVPSDCCAASCQREQESSLVDINTCYGLVVESNDIIELMEKK